MIPDETHTRDALLTAYALGELAPGSDEHAAVEARLADDPDARAEVEAIRATADQLVAALADEPLPAAISPRTTRRGPYRLVAAAGLAAAAAVGFAVALPFFGAERQGPSPAKPQLAMDSPPTTPVLTEKPTFSLQDALSDRNTGGGGGGAGGGASLFADGEGDWRGGVTRNDNSTVFNHEATLTKPQPGNRPAPVATSTRELVREARSLQKDMRYDEALGRLDQALAQEPDHFTAQLLRDVITDARVSDAHTRLLAAKRAEGQAVARSGEAVAVPRTQVLQYPSDWAEFSSARLRGLSDSPQPSTPALAPVPDAGGFDATIKIIPREPAYHTEAYDRVEDNPFRAVWDRPVSTFSVDVDTASYANVRRFLTNGQLPPADAVRIEELINYFDYGYKPPSVVNADAQEQGEIPGAPFSTDIEVTSAPWQPDHRLVRIGLQGVEVATDDRPAANLVFLLDVSGSMNSPNKLPLVKAGMQELVQHLRMDDRVAIVVYAGASGLVLDSTSDHDAVLAAVDNLRPGGSTNGAAGIELAYQIATEHHIPGGLNRVILCTDGDFNVGVTDRGALTRLIEEKANLPGKPTYLSVLGFGTGNVKDATMEQLSNVGDGNYGYVDTLAEARKLLGEQVNATLLTIAKDVKLQVEFNPAKVAAYRLIGYENRVLAREDFNDDTVDAGDIGAGHAVTALYELKLVEGGSEKPAPSVDELRYQRPAGLAEAAKSDELLTLKLRYKLPGAAKEQGTSRLLSFPVADDAVDFAEADEATRWSAAVAGLGMLLRGSPHAGTLTWPGLVEFVESQVDVEGARFADLTPEGIRRVEFARMVRAAAGLAGAEDRDRE
ncbi:MAG: von Willebrand factor type A domain-containing protein [Planctomycetota bacterium]